MIIVLNAPAGSGKDTIADVICKNYEFVKAGFKDKLLEIAYDLAYHYNDSITFDAFLTRCSSRETKEMPWSLLPYSPTAGRPCTPREWLIYVSEVMVKPIFGKHYFGQALTRNIGDSRDVVISDGGFVEEVFPLWEQFGSNLAVVQFCGMGKTSFDGDSRDWINIPGVHTVRMPVDNTPDVAPEWYANMIFEEIYKQK